MALAAEVGLDAGEGPLFGCVTRLTWQKGIDLLLPLLGEIVERGGRVVVVGQGEADLEARLVRAAHAFRGRVAVRLAFDPPLSRRVYAGADFFFVPSRFEPCGLTQMYAMRYGSLPIVTDVGGLHDTVVPIDVAGDSGAGLVASYVEAGSLRDATREAFELFEAPEALARAQLRAMTTDFSWERPAMVYERVYEEAVARTTG